jgi:prepilin-type N-terminal cleavage/methylation domain-containing protein
MAQATTSWSTRSDRRAGRRRRALRGYTLLELLLVLAILVAVASLALPALFSSLESQRLRKAGDQLRAAFGRARVAAMKSGRIQLFRFEPGTGSYVIQEWYGDEERQFDEATLAQSTGGAMAPAAGQGLQTQLPEGILFAAAELQPDARAAQLEEQTGALSAGSTSASPPIVFYTDGTTSDARVVLANNRARYIVVELRGLTGISMVSDLLTQEELPQ